MIKSLNPIIALDILHIVLDCSLLNLHLLPNQIDGSRKTENKSLIVCPLRRTTVFEQKIRFLDVYFATLTVR